MPRDLKTLLADNETPETIQSALDALAEIAGRASPSWVRTTRAEFQKELRVLDGQGRLF